MPVIPIKVEEEDEEDVVELPDQQIGGALKRPSELSNNIPLKKLRVEVNQPSLNDLNRTTGNSTTNNNTLDDCTHSYIRKLKSDCNNKVNSHH